MILRRKWRQRQWWPLCFLYVAKGSKICNSNRPSHAMYSRPYSLFQIYSKRFDSRHYFRSATIQYLLSAVYSTRLFSPHWLETLALHQQVAPNSIFRSRGGRLFPFSVIFCLFCIPEFCKQVDIAATIASIDNKEHLFMHQLISELKKYVSLLSSSTGPPFAGWL